MLRGEWPKWALRAGRMVKFERPRRALRVGRMLGCELQDCDLIQEDDSSGGQRGKV